MRHRVQFRLLDWFWLTLLVAAFWLGRHWSSLEQPALSPRGFGMRLKATGLNSSTGLSGTFVLKDAHLTPPIPAANAKALSR